MLIILGQEEIQSHNY